MTDRQRPPRRALLLGQTFLVGEGGGLRLALDGLQAALEQRGWVIDRPAARQGTVGPRPHDEAGPLARVLRSARFSDLQSRLPAGVRRWFIEVTRPVSYLRRASAEFEASETALRSGAYDAVLVCPQGLPPGLLDLSTRHHPGVTAIGLTALADELRYRRLWQLMRILAGVRTRGGHRMLYRPVAPHAIPQSVFASEVWRQETVAVGLPAERTSTIYFGVRIEPRLPRPRWRDRLLWVGRRAPEKGLHALLSAWPALRRTVPDVTLSVIDGPGDPSYARLIDRLCASHGRGVVRLGPSPHEALRDTYGEHDALVFYSAFDEPVALVVLEAFAAGLPVIASRPGTTTGPLREGDTCLCFDPADASTLVDAVRRLREDKPLAERLTRRARDVVAQEFSLDRMGELWEARLS